MSLDILHKTIAALPVAARRRFAAAVVAAVSPDKPGAVERAVNASDAVRLKALQDTCPEAFADFEKERKSLRFGNESRYGVESHVELKWGRAILFIDVTDSKITVVGQRCFAVSHNGTNALELTPA